jgi:hypothetical protein
MCNLNLHGVLTNIVSCISDQTKAVGEWWGCIHLSTPDTRVKEMDFFIEYCENLSIFFFLISLLGNICVTSLGLLCCCKNCPPCHCSFFPLTFLSSPSQISEAVWCLKYRQSHLRRKLVKLCDVWNIVNLF